MAYNSNPRLPRAHETYQQLYYTSNTSPNRDQTCPICLDDMVDQQSFLTHQHSTCLRSFHSRCLNDSLAAFHDRGVPIRCPNCSNPLPDLHAHEQHIYTEMEQLATHYQTQLAMRLDVQRRDALTEVLQNTRIRMISYSQHLLQSVFEGSKSIEVALAEFRAGSSRRFHHVTHEQLLYRSLSGLRMWAPIWLPQLWCSRFDHDDNDGDGDEAMILFVWKVRPNALLFGVGFLVAVWAYMTKAHGMLIALGGMLAMIVLILVVLWPFFRYRPQLFRHVRNIGLR